DNPRALVGVLGHELGHVKHRHGMRLTLRASAVGLATGVMLGDFSVALASAPALLAQQSYSRGFEREADDYARTVLRGAGIDPAVMVGFFERMKKLHEEGGEGDGGAFAAAFSSHPADDERIEFFRK
ncbi:MAG TPA: M48 family metallopeptidase, partial [Roseateles sp.]